MLNLLLNIANKLFGHHFVALRAKIVFWTRGHAGRVLIVIYIVFLFVLLALVSVFWLIDSSDTGTPTITPSVAVTVPPTSTENPEPTEMPSFARPSFQSAEQITRAYYDLLSDGEHEIAYSLLNQELRGTKNFVWSAWSTEVVRTTYEIIGDLSIEQSGNVHRVEFDLLSTPGGMNKWTFCVVNRSDFWEIRDFMDSPQPCW